ncbi:MAG TPA: serine/threonine-protein kinase [Bryobacteraceae bacterium]|jgi:serine/threonine protein kinase|nr:serine/threonine-protein kinase [Bryobacteraceae bacterium]
MFVPAEIVACLKELEAHYSNYQENGRGANGYVWFAKNRISQAEVAIKFYTGEPGDRRHDEPKLLSAIESPNVLPILDARNVSDEWAYFVTPRCCGGDIDDLITNYPSVHEAIDVVLGISCGVSAIHAAGMVHRDLKPANIVMDEGTPRIADFGSVRTLDSGSNETSASQHSVLYRPPESFASNRYSRSGDVYQIGLVAYQLFGGALPYDGTQYLSTRERKEYEAIEDPIDQSLFVDNVIRQRAETGKLMDFGSLPPWISGGARRALRQMTHPNSGNRLASVADVAAAMSKLRTTHDDWRFIGPTAQLATLDKVIELRPTKSNRYEAFQRKTGTFRRMPGMEPSTLADLIKRCS